MKLKLKNLYNMYVLKYYSQRYNLCALLRINFTFGYTMFNFGFTAYCLLLTAKCYIRGHKT